MSNFVRGWICGVLVGVGVTLSIQEHTAHAAEPIPCDPFTPLYDYRLCYVLEHAQTPPPSKVPAPPVLGGRGSYP